MMDKGAIIVVLLIAIAAIFLGVYFTEPTVKTTVLIDHLSLQSMKDNTYLRGHFLIGSGSMDEGWQYTLYYRGDDGMLHMGIVSANRVSIRETNSSPPVLDIFETTYSGQWTGLGHGGAGVQYLGNTLVPYSNDMAIATIPIGSVDNSFVMDGES